jgi:hypothetical protein
MQFCLFYDNSAFVSHKCLGTAHLLAVSVIYYCVVCSALTHAWYEHWPAIAQLCEVQVMCTD